MELTKSGLDYTIIHPGGLIDTPASQQQLVLDVDDKLLKNEKLRLQWCVKARRVNLSHQSYSLRGYKQHPALREVRGSQILSTETALQIQDGFPKSLLELILKELGLEMF